MAEEIKSFRITLAYVGTAYMGWQRQAHASGDLPTAQEALNGALRSVLQTDKFSCHASGRTDTGVHAEGQVVHLHAPTNMQPEQIKRALNSVLPIDIRVRDCQKAPANFHAQHDSKRKTYRYFILLEQAGFDGAHSPFLRPYAWYVTFPLNIPAMKNALTCLKGSHDFAAFKNQGTDLQSTVREIFTAELIMHPQEKNPLPWEPYAHHQLLEIRLVGSGFLKQMVRNIVGTVVEIGRGKLPVEAMENILASKNRQNAGATAPANGLFLSSVEY